MNTPELHAVVPAQALHITNKSDGSGRFRGDLPHRPAKGSSEADMNGIDSGWSSPRTRSEGHSTTGRRAALLAVFLMVVLTALLSGAANAATIPGAPQNLAASAGVGQNNLSWTAPSSNGGATITSYRVFRGTTISNRVIVTTGTCANLGAVLSCLDTGLTNGQSYDYIVSAVNSIGQGPPSSSATATPAAALSITTTALNPATATVGVGYSAQQAVAATGGLTPYTWSASGLPSGMGINATTGAVFGTPTVAGTFNFTVTVTDNSSPQKTASKVLSITVAAATPALSITTTALNPATATVGVGYSAQQAVAATGGLTPYTWSASGLPSGMGINATTGAVFGTPTVAGTFNFTVTVTDNSSPQKTASKVLSITVAATTTALSITTTALNPATATVGVGYSAYQAVVATGGLTPYIWSASGLPSGTGINATTGAVFGTPTAAGTFNFTVTVTDSSSPQKTASKVLSIAVGNTAAAIPAIPTGLSPGSASSPGPTLGSSALTVSWNTSSGATLYTGGIIDIAAGSTVVTINTGGTSAAATLSPGKQYRWYVSACNSNGCSNSSAPYYFRTPVPPSATPQCTLTASPSTVILGGSATLTATCSPAATSYAWAPATGLVAGPGNTAAVTPTAKGAYQYSVTGSNASGAGNTVTASINSKVPLEQTSPERVALNVFSNNAQWPNPAANAVIITHGWNADAKGWVKDMAVDICAKLGGVPPSALVQDLSLIRICQANNWDVWVVDWSSQAAPLLNQNSFDFIGPNFGLPMDAYVNAIHLGKNLASILAGKNYSHIHLIAHSAGSNLIDFATRGLKYYQPATTIHNTFLDAYDPVSDSSRYGEKADWTDNYVDTRDVFNINGLDGTKLFLQNGYNIDVTPNAIVDPCLADPICRHSRPYRFFGRSIAPNFMNGTVDMLLDPINDGTGGVGYPLSVENGQSLTSLNNILPKGTKCVMGGGICYPGSLPPSVWYFLPGALANTVVDGVTGTINYVTGVGATLLNSLQLVTASPSWITVQATTTQPVNTLRFDWAFASAGEGLLRIYVNDTPVRTIDQRHVPPASLATEEVYVGGEAGMLPPGTHKIAFRLDGFGANASGVQLTNVGVWFVTASAGGSVPDAPTIVSTTIGVGSITVNFAAPASNGGTAITGFTAACTSSNGGISGLNTGDTSATSIQVSGLTNGKSYTCTVKASNSVGTSQASASSNAVTPFDITPILFLLLED